MASSGTPLRVSQRRIKDAERATLRELQDVYKCLDSGALPPSPLKRSACSGLSTVARRRREHSFRYYGECDRGHARWAALLDEARWETENYLAGDNWDFAATATVLQGYTAPRSPAKLPRRRRPTGHRF